MVTLMAETRRWLLHIKLTFTYPSAMVGFLKPYASGNALNMGYMKLVVDLVVSENFSCVSQQQITSVEFCLVAFRNKFINACNETNSMYYLSSVY
jgi:hypothetical protein